MDSTSVAFTIAASFLFLLYTLYTTRQRMYFLYSHSLNSQLVTSDPAPLQKRRKLSQDVCVVPVEAPITVEARPETVERRDRGTAMEKAGKRGRDEDVDPREIVRREVEERGKRGSKLRLYSNEEFQQARARFFACLHSSKSPCLDPAGKPVPLSAFVPSNPSNNPHRKQVENDISSQPKNLANSFHSS